MRERVVLLEQQCWSNSHYSRSECLEISGFSESLKNEDLEGTAVTVCEEFELVVDPSNVEDCHGWQPRTHMASFQRWYDVAQCCTTSYRCWNNTLCLQESRTDKKVLIKLSKSNDAKKIRKMKRNLKNLILSGFGIIIPVFINDSLSSYYNMLWANCKKLSSSKVMLSGFQMTL